MIICVYPHQKDVLKLPLDELELLLGRFQLLGAEGKALLGEQKYGISDQDTNRGEFTGGGSFKACTHQRCPMLLSHPSKLLGC